MSKCAYYSKSYHPQSSCMNEQIDMLTQLLENNNIPFLISQRRRKEDQIQKTEREYIPWLISHQAHLVSSLILELQDIWFRPRRNSRHLTCRKVHQLYWEMTLSLKFWAKGGLILTMVSSEMCCMFQVLPLTSYQCIR